MPIRLLALAWLVVTGCDPDADLDASVELDAAATVDGSASDAALPRADAAAFDASPPLVDAATGSEPLPAGVTMLSFEEIIDGAPVDRPVLLHAPRSVESGAAYPIVVALHGAGGRNEQWVGRLGAIIDSGRFVGVYPQGHNRVWNLGGSESSADDIAFIERIVDDLARYRELDSSRRFIYGTSNGAGLAHALAVQTDRFDAIAAIVTQLSRGNEPTASSTTVSVLQVLGTDDPIIPYEGGGGPMSLDFYPAEESAAIWATHDGCEGTGARSTTASGNIRIEYAMCRAGARVLHYGVVGAGHGLPRDTEGGLVELALGFFEATP